MKLWNYFVIFYYYCLLEVKSDLLVGTLCTAENSCTTPNGEAALCTSLRFCPLLKKAYCSEDPIVQHFVEDSACKDGKFMVCCGTFANFTKKSTEGKLSNATKENQEKPKQSPKEYALMHLLPTKKYCGLQHTDDYFYNETETSVDEFPWLVPVYEYRERFKDYWDYAGIIINKRYVLTYVPCDTNLVKVGLGQHHRNKTVSCIKTPYGDDCTDPIIEVNITEIIHFGKCDYNGIQLLRVAKAIYFTDFVRPICLPFNEWEVPKVNDTVVTSGWDTRANKGETVNIKKRNKLIITSLEKTCGPPHVSKARVIPRPKNPICVRSIEKNVEKNCASDLGGTMMYKYKNNWFAIGLFTGHICKDTLESVAEQITPTVVDWILENMRR